MCGMRTGDLHSVASGIGKWLPIEDRNDLMLAHPCFKHAHADKTFHSWSIYKWPPEQCAQDAGVWERKWQALAHRKPRLHELLVALANDIIPKESLKSMMRALAPRVQLLTLQIAVSQKSLEPFVQALEECCGNLRINRMKLLIYLGTLSDNALPAFSRLSSVLRRLNSSNIGSNTTAQFTIVSEAPAEVLTELASFAPITERIKYKHDRGTRVSLSEESFQRLASVPDLDVINEVHLSTISTTGRTQYSIVEAATTIRDAIILTYNDSTLNHLSYIALKCRRLHRYVVDHVCIDAAFYDGGSAVRSWMEKLDESSIQELCLCKHSLLNPAVVFLLRRMLQLKTRPGLRVGVLVTDDEPDVYALCAELVSRYVPGINVVRNHAKSSSYQRMAHEALLAAMKTACADTWDAWSMMVMPAP